MAAQDSRLIFPKRLRLGPRLVKAAHARRGYNAAHAFIGGTGAVGGSALFKSIELYEEMFARTPPGDDVPILITTGKKKKPDIRDFLSRLERSEQAKYGPAGKPKKVWDGRLTYAGIYIEVSTFALAILDGLDDDVLEKLESGSEESRYLTARETLAANGIDVGAPADALREQLLALTRERRPFTGLLSEKLNTIRSKIRPIEKFESVTIGIPMPSLLAYSPHAGALERALSPAWGQSAAGLADRLKQTFEDALIDDIGQLRSNFTEQLFIAHTTAIGGMYDVDVDHHGNQAREIRLGFAHSARDQFLAKKQEYAENLTRKFTSLNAKVLITAAAIGVDEVQINQDIPLHRDAVKAIRELKEAQVPDDVPFDGPRPDAQHEGRVLLCRPIDTGVDSEPSRPFITRFKVYNERTRREEEHSHPVQPRFALRSGENGLFSVANTDALYRVMRVATESELGFVLASVALFGEDERAPSWFPGGQCYYTETDNSRAAFGFLYQPALLEAQLSGMEPMALQDLGSAKHQAELHLLALLILLHRLHTLDWDAIDPYQSDSFNVKEFILTHSRALTFRDVETWTPEGLETDLRTLVEADTPADLLRFAGSGWGVFPLRDAARDRILAAVLEAVWNAPSLGTPYVYDRAGETRFRTGWFVAPLLKAIGTQRGLGDALRSDYEKLHEGRGLSFSEYVDFCVAANGFIDIRPGAVVCKRTVDRGDMSGTVVRCNDEAELITALSSLTPYQQFAASGILVILHRLRMIGRAVHTSMIELGTQQDWVWQIPRDSSGHALVVPGIVEALRMSAEGLEKTTGTEWLDGPWGYVRARPVDRRSLAE